MLLLEFAHYGERIGFLGVVGAHVAGVEEAGDVHIAHGGEDVLLEVRVLAFEIREDVAQGAADGSGFLGATAGDDGDAEGFGVGARDFLGDVHQRADQAVFAACAIR